MKQRNTWPRQPFLGLSIATGAGILAADAAPSATVGVIIALGILAIVALLSRKSLAVYAFVATGFFLVTVGAAFSTTKRNDCVVAIPVASVIFTVKR